MNWFRENQSDVISLDNNEDAKIEYIMEEVDDQLNRVRTFRREEASDEQLEQWIEVTHKTRVNNIQVIEETIDVNPAIYIPYTWQQDFYQDILHLKDRLEANLYKITSIYLEEV